MGLNSDTSPQTGTQQYNICAPDPCLYHRHDHTHTQVRPSPGHGTHTRGPPPVVTVGEPHVHAVAAQEGLAVQGDVHVGRVLDGLTHDDEAGEQGLLVTADTTVRGAAAVDLHLARAVQHLGTSHGGSGVG